MAEWLGRRACNLVVPGSCPPPRYSLDCSQLPRARRFGCALGFTNTVFMYVTNLLVLTEKLYWGSGQ